MDYKEETLKLKREYIEKIDEILDILPMIECKNLLEYIETVYFSWEYNKFLIKLWKKSVNKILLWQYKAESSSIEFFAFIFIIDVNCISKTGEDFLINPFFIL